MQLRSRRTAPLNLPLLGATVFAFAGVAVGAVFLLARQYGLA
jgi:hypothetical protein